MFSQNIQLQDNDSILSWREDRKLRWNDFKGKVSPNTFGNANTAYKIEILPTAVLVDENDHVRNHEQLTARAHFYKNVSWKTTSNSTVLAHEQLHFDIAELFARKLRKRFQYLVKNDVRNFNNYYGEYRQVWEDCRALQKQYDSETNHGINTFENDKWKALITSELEKLSAFEAEVQTTKK